LAQFLGLGEVVWGIFIPVVRFFQSGLLKDQPRAKALEGEQTSYLDDLLCNGFKVLDTAEHERIYAHLTLEKEEQVSIVFDGRVRAPLHILVSSTWSPIVFGRTRGGSRA
jgi:hypothetical protein